MKRIIAFFAVLMLSASLLACDEVLAEKQFTSGNITITLDESFEEKSVERADASFISEELCVYYIYDANKYFGRRIDTMERYRDIVAKSQGVRKDEVIEDGKLVYMVYEDEVLLSKYNVVAFLFEVDGEFSRVEFVCESAQLEERMPQILERARSIKISKSANNTVE